MSLDKIEKGVNLQNIVKILTTLGNFWVINFLIKAVSAFKIHEGSLDKI